MRAQLEILITSLVLALLAWMAYAQLAHAESDHAVGGDSVVRLGAE